MAIAGPCRIDDSRFGSARVHRGESGLLDLIRETGADVVLNGISGAAGLLPSLAALEAGRDLALANKESIVMAGPLVLAEAARRGRLVLPVDSEHAALFSILRPLRREEVAELVITASGGAFRDLPPEQLASVRFADALAHPTWRMGPKITVDSATLANKGLEVIEAHRLFGVPLDRVKVLVHRDSRVHAMVRTVDGTLHLEASTPDMRIPIQNALTHPDVLPTRVPWLDLAAGKLEFEPVDAGRYPMLDLAYRAAGSGPALPIVFNAADEVAVEAFHHDAITFLRISSLVEEVLSLAWPARVDTVEEVLAVDREARSRAAERLA
ncbi:MAG: 1-deoxy-D-xylulose-5-phosphate reductoisomerase [Spirochaetes bacterium]|nr:1-deoxy-D-xylulose-5-phosphate reductoisomerase [Spirochaetota bacterium]